MNGIAIQGHPTRGKEVIQILESLGGKNTSNLKGTEYWYYYIDNNYDKLICCHDYKYVNTYCKKYTLEEFEKKFPFKIRDKVITTLGHIGTITNIKNNKYEVFFKTDSALITSKKLNHIKKWKKKET